MKKVFAFMVLLLLISTVLCGCKDGTKEGAKNPVSSGEVSFGGKVTVGITQDLDSLDPHKAVAAGTKEVLYNIFEGLVKVDKDGNLIPAVAESYEISSDGLKYTFKIRKNVKFHNGSVVTAEDVIYSLKRVAGMLETQDPEVLTVSAFSNISEINKTEEGVEVVLKEPNSELIGFFTSSIIPKDYDAQATSPVGTGPFKFVSYEPLVGIEMKKNEEYYIANVPYLDEVTFKITSNSEAAFLELVGGNIDIMPYLTQDQADQLGGRMDVLAGTMNLVQALFLNNQSAPFDDVRVRQAICYALNRQEILDLVAGGKGVVIGTNMFPTFTKYYNEETEKAYLNDIEKSKSLLKEAGYADGFTFTITVPSNYDYHVKTAEVIVSQLAKVGIDAKIKLVEWATWLSDVYVGRNFEATVIGLDSQLAPSDVLRFYPSTSSKNFINYYNPKFDELFAKAKAVVDEEEKAANYKELEQVLSDDAASAYICSPVQLVAINKEVGGYTFYPVYVQDMSTVYIKAK